MKLQQIEIKNETSVMRLNLKREEYELLIKMLNNMKLNEDDFKENGCYDGYESFKDGLFDKLQNVKQIDTSSKRIATSNANTAKINKSKNLVDKAVKLLSSSNKKVTIYSVSKESGLSYNTVKKYFV